MTTTEPRIDIKRHWERLRRVWRCQSCGACYTREHYANRHEVERGKGHVCVLGWLGWSAGK